MSAVKFSTADDIQGCGEGQMFEGKKIYAEDIYKS